MLQFLNNPPPLPAHAEFSHDDPQVVALACRLAADLAVAYFAAVAYFWHDWLNMEGAFNITPASITMPQYFRWHALVWGESALAADESRALRQALERLKRAVEVAERLKWQRRERKADKAVMTPGDHAVEGLSRTA